MTSIASKMLRTALLRTAVVACTLLAGGPALAAEKPAVSPVARGQIQLGLGLLGAGDGNRMVSPVGVAAVLAMLAEGGDSATRTAVAKLVGAKDETALSGFGRTLKALAKGSGDPAVEVATANAVWLDTRTDLFPAFLRSVKERFAADVQQTSLGTPDGVARVNRWVADRTRGRIERLLETPPSKPSLIALNALYFDGKWALPFDPAATAPKPFAAPGGKVEVPTMALDGKIGYREDATVQAVELAYGAGRFRLVVALPKEAGADPAAWAAGRRAELAPVLLGQGFAPRSGTLELPRLALSGEAELLEALKALGLEKALARPNAFAGIALPPPTLGRVLQKTVLSLDEKGTQAAAATAAIAERAFVVEDKFTMRVDRPFLFALRDGQSGAVLMLGVVRQPGR